MKLKNLIYLLPFSVMGCVGLEQYPTNSYTDANFWQNEDNVRAALNLGYNQCWSWDYYFANNNLSDDVFGSRHSENERNIATGQANTSSGRFSGEWNACYQELRTVHTALEAQDRFTVDEAFKTRMIAELRLMRAWTYFRLITWYGDVPFFTHNLSLPEAREVGVTDENTIRQFVLDELDAVAAILPKNTEIPAEENGRYTCGTAIAIKARVYLYNNDFENCATECEKLINTTEYGTYSLADNFDELFKTGYYGPESIMTIETAYEGGIENIRRGWSPGGWVPQSIGNRGVTSWSPTQELVDVFRKIDGSVADDTDYGDRDKRFYSTIAYNGCKVEVPAARTDLGLTTDADGCYTCWTDPADQSAYGNGVQNDAYDGSQDRTATGYYALKNYYAPTIDNGGSSLKPIMEIRFAEILLNYAESKYEMGEMTSEVWDKTIKPLRTRAGFAESYCNYPGGDVRQAIRDERRAELALEGRRVFDLRRWAVMEDATIRETGASFLTSQATGAPFMDDGSSIICSNPYNMKYWFAIPQSERDINHNLPQNPGW